MAQKTPNTDGFVIPRRPRPQTSSARLDTMRRPVASAKLPSVNPIQTIGNADSKTPPIETPTKLQTPLQPQRRKKRFAWRKPSRKTVKRIILILIALILLGVGYFAYKFFTTGNKIFKGNPITAILSQGKDLKADQYGRSNILLFGTSEDDPGHDGGNLTDSIMVMSVDQKKNDAFLISIPRDLYVTYGTGCNSGFKGKVNEVYGCHLKGGDEDRAQAALRSKIGEIVGLDLQYAVHVNYTVLREAVAAVSGITVTIESRDPRGILDSNFDWKCGVGDRKVSRAEVLRRCPPSGHFIQFPNGPVQLDAEHALYLAQARGNTAPTYGLEQSNFDREVNQRKILIALKDKAVSAGTLANPIAMSNLLDALGNNIRTNFDADEIKTLVRVGKEIKNENIRSIVTNDQAAPLMTTGHVGSESIVKPVAGLDNYSAIQAIVKAYATGDYAVLEKATIAVLNASGKVGAAQTKADEIIDSGLTIKAANITNAPETLGTAPILLYDQSGGKKPETLKKLEKILGVKARTDIPAGIGSDADLIVVVGKSNSPDNE
jgi:anionic cell wall polymer biosynthesis LytR-Cps2A-Psr (LCP) family protein